MAGVIKTTFHINNNYRMLSIQQQYPWQECQEKTPLPPDLLEQLSHQWGGGVWIGEGALYSASPEQGKVERNLIEKALKGIVKKLMFFDENKFKMASKMSPIFKVFTGVEIKDKVDLIYHKNPQRGMITEKVLKMAYWRKKTPPTDKLNLDLDACGMIWCVPAVPFLGNHLRNALNIISSIAQKYGYELKDLNQDPLKDLLSMRKDPRQIWYGLEPGWVVNLKDETILKPTDKEWIEYYKS